MYCRKFGWEFDRFENGFRLFLIYFVLFSAIETPLCVMHVITVLLIHKKEKFAQKPNLNMKKYATQENVTSILKDISHMYVSFNC